MNDVILRINTKNSWYSTNGLNQMDFGQLA